MGSAHYVSGFYVIVNTNGRIEHFCLNINVFLALPCFCSTLKELFRSIVFSTDVHVWWGFFSQEVGIIYRTIRSHLFHLPSLWSASLDKSSCERNSLLGRAWDKHHWLLNQRFGIANRHPSLLVYSRISFTSFQNVSVQYKTAVCTYWVLCYLPVLEEACKSNI